MLHMSEMTKQVPSPKRLGFLFMALLTFACISKTTLATDQYDTIGFSSNHVLADGGFGERIDLMTGSLNLNLPIGPRYQVSPTLSYQFVLYYNSHIWAYDDIDNTADTSVHGRVTVAGCFGAGIRGHFGRVYRDYNDYDGTGNDHTEVWRLETPDGSQHYFGTSSSYLDSVQVNHYMTVDNTYVRMTMIDDLPPAGVPDGWIAEQPDGTRWILDHKVGDPENPKDNRPDKGWYVSRMESAENPDMGPNATACGNHYDCDRPHFVNIAYAGAQDSPSAACPYLVTDSVLRTIDFSGVAQGSGYVVTRIALPGGATRPLYDFGYATNAILCDPRNILMGGNCSTSFASHPLLTKVLYPPASGPDRFEIDLGWGGLDVDSDGIADDADADGSRAQTNFGLMVKRTLPYVSPNVDPPRVLYKYRFANYLKEFSVTVELTKKRLVWKRDGQSISHWWRYRRPDDDKDNYFPFPSPYQATNPGMVQVWDPFDNLTEYQFKNYWLAVGSPQPGDPNMHTDGNCIDPGKPSDSAHRECPSFWDSGLLTAVYTYRGCSENASNLIRAVMYEYEGDPSGSAPARFQYRNPRSTAPLTRAELFWIPRNVRMKAQTIQYPDAASAMGGPPEARVEFTDWDGHGHYRNRIEKNEQGEIYRTIRTAYQTAPMEQPWFTGRFDSVTIQNSSGLPIQRTDYCWSTTHGAYMTRPNCIARLKDPVVGFSCSTCTPNLGDITESLEYQDAPGAIDLPTGSLRRRVISGGDDSTGDGTTVYKIDYFYSPGGLTAREQVPLQGWYAKEQVWDSVKGLVTSSKDRSGNETQFQYDGLGRLKLIDSPGAEADTTLLYSIDGHSVTVSQAASGLGSISSIYKYDDLYRLTETWRLSANDGQWNVQKLSYDALGRLSATSGWVAAGSTSGSTDTTSYGDLVGASCPDKDGDGSVDYEFDGQGLRSYPDPVGRISNTTAAGVSKTWVYGGLSSTVTTSGIAGPSYGGSISATTTYKSDVFGRVVAVDAPSGVADGTFVYDERDNLVNVSLCANGATGCSTQTDRQARWFSYDALGNLKSTESPESGSQVFNGYDSVGNLQKLTDAKGKEFAYSYDTVGHIKQIVTMNPMTILETRTYDGSGRLDTVVSNSDSGDLVSEKKRLYTGLNGRIGELQTKLGEWSSPPAILRTLYEYNDFGVVRLVRYPFQDNETRTRSVPESITHNGTITALKDSGRLPTEQYYYQNITYNAAGLPNNIQAVGNQQLAISYDSWTRPLRYTLSRFGYGCPPTVSVECSGEFPCDDENGLCNPGQPHLDTWWDSGFYAYDGAGNISAIGSSYYRYDANNRLTEANLGGNADWRAWTYDPLGNVLTESQLNVNPSVFRSFAISPVGSNRLSGVVTSVSGQTISTVALAYDQSGSMIQNGSTINEWDRLGRLKSIQQSTGLIDSFSYDEAGHRVRKIERELETFYIRDEEGRVLSEYRRPIGVSSAPVWDKDYVYTLGHAVAIVKNSAPSTPTNIRITAHNTAQRKVTVEWDAGSDTDVAYFMLQRDINGGTPTIVTIPVVNDPENPSPPGYVDTLPSGTNTSTAVIHYKMLATDTGYHSSPLSAPVAFKFVQSVPTLTTPTAAGEDRRVVLSWPSVSSATTPDVAAYQVFRGGSSISGNISSPCGPNLMCYTESGLTNGVQYCYTYKALDTRGRIIGTSASACATPVDGEAPSAPASLAAISGPGTGQVTVSWPLGREADIGGYRLDRGVTTSAATIVVNGSISVSNCINGWCSYTESGVSSGLDYYYFLKAKDSATSANWSPASVSGAVRARSALPVGPTLLSGQFDVDTRGTIPNICDPVPLLDDRAQVKVTFAPSSSAQSYRIYRRSSNTSPWQLLGQTACPANGSDPRCRPEGPNLVFFDTNVGGPTYDYVITALDGTGSNANEGGNGNVVSVSDGFGTPGPETGNFRAVDTLTDTAADAEESIGPDCTFVQLAWSPSLEQRLVGYKVYRKCEGSVTRLVTDRCPAGWELVSGAVPIAQTFYLDRDSGANARMTRRYATGGPLESGYDWVYMVTAVLERGDGTRVESQAAGTPLISLSQCVDAGWGRDPAMYNYCINTAIRRCTDDANPNHSCSSDSQCNSPATCQTVYPNTNIEHESAIPLPGPPDTPVGVEASAGAAPGGIAYADVRVKWTPGNAAAISGYHLYYRNYDSANDAPWIPVDTFLVDTNLDGTWESGNSSILLARFTEIGASKIQYAQYRRLGKTQYRVQAVDQLGRESSPSAPVVGWPYIEAPTNMDARHNCARTQGRVQWKDNDGDLDGTSRDYNIFRRERYPVNNPTFPVTPLAKLRSYSPSGSAFVWFDTQVESGKKYAYKVTAVYGVGITTNGSAEFDSDSVSNDDDGTFGGACTGFQFDPEDDGVPEPDPPLAMRQRDVEESSVARDNETIPNEQVLGDNQPVVGYGHLSMYMMPSSQRQTGGAGAAVNRNSSEQSKQESPTITGGAAHIGVVNVGWEVQLLWVDHLGSTRVVSSKSGELLSRHSFLPYGDPVGATSMDNTHAFTGHEHDRENGLDYFLARYYGSAHRRLLSPDLVEPAELGQGETLDRYISNTGSWNKYSYALNNPIALNDPNGDMPAAALALPAAPALPALAPILAPAAAAAVIVGSAVAVGVAAYYGTELVIESIHEYNDKKIARTAIASLVASALTHLGYMQNGKDGKPPHDYDKKKWIKEIKDKAKEIKRYAARLVGKEREAAYRQAEELMNLLKKIAGNGGGPNQYSINPDPNDREWQDPCKGQPLCGSVSGVK